MKYLILPTAIFLTMATLWSCRQTTTQHSESKVPYPETVEASSGMALAAQTFLNGLNETQRAKATFEFEDDERFNWHFIPKDDRLGARWSNMTEEQKAHAKALMRTALSEQGQSKATSIMQLELILREVESRPADDEYRNPGKYFISIYGTPSNDGAWGWRFEGHHLSLSFSSVSDEIVATPAFMGTNPAIVRTGPAKGREVLKAEQDMGRAFVKSLDAAQQKVAIIDVVAPDDLITFVDKRVKLEGYEGLAATEMTTTQREQLLALVMVYINNLEESVAEKQLARVKASGLDQLYFAWAGGIEAGEKHYYRIHGPSLLIEYDNTQNDGNHIHTVLRDPTNDFAEDLLKKHYERSHGNEEMRK